MVAVDKGLRCGRSRNAAARGRLIVRLGKGIEARHGHIGGSDRGGHHGHACRTGSGSHALGERCKLCHASAQWRASQLASHDRPIFKIGNGDFDIVDDVGDKLLHIGFDDRGLRLKPGKRIKVLMMESPFDVGEQPLWPSWRWGCD